MPDPLELVMDLGLGRLAHHAAVEDYQVGIIERLGRLTAIKAKLVAHASRVGRVHLAADGPDVEAHAHAPPTIAVVIRKRPTFQPPEPARPRPGRRARQPSSGPAE